MWGSRTHLLSQDALLPLMEDAACTTHPQAPAVLIQGEHSVDPSSTELARHMPPTDTPTHPSQEPWMQGSPIFPVFSA